MSSKESLCNRFPVIGVVVLVRRPNRCRAGEVDMPSDGVFLMFNKPMNVSDLSALQRFIIFFNGGFCGAIRLAVSRVDAFVVEFPLLAKVSKCLG